MLATKSFQSVTNKSAHHGDYLQTLIYRLMLCKVVLKVIENLNIKHLFMLLKVVFSMKLLIILIAQSTVSVGVNEEYSLKIENDTMIIILL